MSAPLIITGEATLCHSLHLSLSDGQVVIRRSADEWYSIADDGFTRRRCGHTYPARLEEAYQIWLKVEENRTSTRRGRMKATPTVLDAIADVIERNLQDLTHDEVVNELAHIVTRLHIHYECPTWTDWERKWLDDARERDKNEAMLKAQARLDGPEVTDSKNAGLGR